MDERNLSAEDFQAHRAHLRGVAYRMLGSLSEAEDAVQEAWLHLSRADTRDVANPRGWLTTVVARVCLDFLRTRKSRREEPEDEQGADPFTPRTDGSTPEQEALMADSVGVALLVVLDALNPPERIAFVLHDLFSMSFDEIAPIVGRNAAATRQLASRARRRVHGAALSPDADLSRQHEVVSAFLAASRGGDLDALLAVLDPDVVVRTDMKLPPGAPREVHGARNVANQARLHAARARVSQIALIDGQVGVVVAPRGRLHSVLLFTVVEGRIRALETVFDPAALGQLGVSVFPT
ncbi:sigma-70 family RNA polymerase sigma factor [Myxococcus stipitatus]|uniref:sigma-70 family RNA polymerase sigma factor n=1 Tax=Myxococcus stipitatus TaxID=83455 RepID=UPI003144FCCB